MGPDFLCPPHEARPCPLSSASWVPHQIDMSPPLPPQLPPHVSACFHASVRPPAIYKVSLPVSLPVHHSPPFLYYLKPQSLFCPIPLTLPYTIRSNLKMKCTVLAAAASTIAAIGAYAAPSIAERQDIDTTVLNFALTLEYLENRFYADGLSQFDAAAFEQAGFPDWVRGRLVQIGEHEATHVAFLQTALGSGATSECTYSFPYTEPKSFVALAGILEGVGVTAYSGAAQLLTDKSTLTAAAVILSTEARHQAWIGSAAEKGAPWSGAFDTPLDVDQVYTLAASFITSCPSSNPALPVTAFPALTVSPAAPAPGSTATMTFNANGTPGPYYAAFFSGLSTTFVELAQDGSVIIPSDLMGTVYAVISTNGTSVTDGSTVAGPAILSFPFNSMTENDGTNQE